MTDGDDKLRARYREIGREEPPAAIDAAIHAAARRAIAQPRASQRWAIPVSIAAVLFLAVGVTLRMQHEQPGIETSMPTSEYPVPSSAAPAMEEKAKIEPPVQPSPRSKADVAPPTPPPPLERPQAMRDAAPPAVRADAARAEQRTRSEESVLQKRATEAVAPGAAATAQAPTAPPAPEAFSRAPMRAEPPPVPDRSASTTPAEPPMSAAPAPAAPPAVAASQSAPRRAKRESLGAAADASREAADPRERELERIARLRAEGRDVEADAALERFRRDNPEYRIPPAMLDKVERREGSKRRGPP